jgi:hypothetical protein
LQSTNVSSTNERYKTRNSQQTTVESARRGFDVVVERELLLPVDEVRHGQERC